MGGHDFGVPVIGPGSGGSVAALRLTEKGYRVAVAEAAAASATRRPPRRVNCRTGLLVLA
jgi:choline dehydrogenase-like flavoprotein